MKAHWMFLVGVAAVLCLAGPGLAYDRVVLVENFTNYG